MVTTVAVGDTTTTAGTFPGQQSGCDSPGTWAYCVLLECACPTGPTKNPLHWADWFVFALSLLVSLLIGLYPAYFVKHETTAEDFHVGKRDFKIWPVTLALVGAFISAISILGTPAEMYTAGAEYWIYMFGWSFASILAALIFAPLLYPLKIVSSYEYLERRFKSKAVKVTGSVILIISQLLYMGIVLYSPSTALEAVTGLPASIAIVATGAIAIIYVVLGGLKATVWTSAFQAVLMIVGLLMVIIKVCIDLKGFDTVWDINDSTGRINLIDFNPSIFERHTFWTLIVGGTISWLSTYGVNQGSVQKFSAVPSLKYAQVVLFLNVPGIMIMVSVCCMAGLCMFAWYQYVGCDPYTTRLVENSNQLLPYYVVDRLAIPTLPGFFLASLFAGALSTMSTGLGSCTACTWEDMMKGKFGKYSDRAQTIINQIVCLCYGLLAVGVGIWSQSLGGTVLQAALSFNGAAAGPLLGLFFLGGCFPCAEWIGAVTGGIVGLAYPLWISFGSYNTAVYREPLPYNTDFCYLYNISVPVEDVNATRAPTVDELTGLDKMYQISYLWYAAIGGSVTVILGLLVSLFVGCKDPADVDPKYNLPLFDRIFCCLPDSTLSVMRCKIDVYDPEEIKALETGRSNVAKDPNSFIPIVIVDAWDEVSGSSNQVSGSSNQVSGSSNQAFESYEGEVSSESSLPPAYNGHNENKQSRTHEDDVKKKNTSSNLWDTASDKKGFSSIEMSQGENIQQLAQLQVNETINLVEIKNITVTKV